MGAGEVMARLTLTFLGSFQAAIDGVPISRFRSDKARALLAYLAVEAERPHSRASLCGLLWPDQSDDAALCNLSQTLLRLREALGDTRSAAAFLRVSRQAIQWNVASDYCLDTADFARLASSTEPTELEQAAALYRGEFLRGFSLAGRPAFEEWLLLTRERFAHLALAALDALARAGLAGGRYVEAAQHARRQLALDPWREEAHRQLMRALAASGDRAAALAAYTRCRQVLHDELGVAPDEATRALYQQIRTSELGIENEELRKIPALHSQFSMPLEQPIQRSAERPQLAADEQLAAKEIGRAGDARPKHRVAWSSPVPVSRSPTPAWGEVPEVGLLYGRQAEAAQVEQWLLHDRCRLIAVLGMGGVGKTALAASVVQAVAAHFDIVIWHSLLNAPPLDEILRATLQVLSGYSSAEAPASVGEQLELLLEYLRRSRCLLILDNMESILQPGQAGTYQAGYAPYGQLIQRLGESRHSSCLLLTSRERPLNLARLSEDLPTVQMLRLSGLEPCAGRAMLTARGLPIQDQDGVALVQRYSGNPLALKLVAQTVQELFGGQLGAFLALEAPIFDDIGAVLDQQYARLSALEQDMLLWLAIGRTPMTVVELRADLLQPGSPREFMEALRGLQRRGLLEQAAQPSGAAFAVQNVILEYLTERLVDEICGAIEGEDVQRFNRHALLKAQAKEYIRQTQARLFVQRVAERWAGRVGWAGMEARLRGLLASLRERTPRLPGYAGGNVLNLLLHLGVDPHGYNFSQLSVWQADLRGVASAAIDFSHADLSHSAFTTVFRVIALRFTAARQLLVAGLMSDELCLWRAADGCLHNLFRRPGAGGHPVVFSPDGQILANCGLDHSVRVWSTASGERLHTLQGHTDRLYTLAFSADGRRLASSSCDGTVRVWDLTSDQLLLILHEHATRITALAFSTDGTMLVGGGDRVIYLWHTDSGQVIQTLLGHSREIECFAFTADNRQLVSGAHDGSIRLWDVGSGECMRTLQGHSQIVRTLALHPDGHTLASGGADRVVRLWDLRDGQTLRMLFGHAYEIAALAFSADGQVLASGSIDPIVKLWDTCSGNALDSLRGDGEIVHSIHFSPDGQLLASSSATGTVGLWDVGALEAAAVARGQLVRSLQGHAPVVRSVVFSPDGGLLASGGTDQVVQVWDVESGTARHVFRGHTNTIKALAFRPDGQVLASAGSDRTIRLWPVSAASTPAGQTEHVLRGHTDEIGSLAFSPDGRTLLSSSLDHTARIWAIDGGQETRVLAVQGCELSGAVFSPDGQLAVATAYDGTVHAWDVGSGQRHELWSGSDITAELVAFSPDGAALACVRSDQAIEIRRAATGAVLQTLRGHRGAFLSIAFSPTQPILASSGWDGMIRVWDVETGACLHTLHAPGPYAGMNISGVTGISETQKAALKALGAVDEALMATS
jgi:WD40 repeat protein/DNA-binding SARP family transcriptional activator